MADYSQGDQASPQRPQRDEEAPNATAAPGDAAPEEEISDAEPLDGAGVGLPASGSTSSRPACVPPLRLHLAAPAPPAAAAAMPAASAPKRIATAAVISGGGGGGKASGKAGGGGGPGKRCAAPQVKSSRGGAAALAVRAVEHAPSLSSSAVSQSQRPVTAGRRPSCPGAGPGRRR